MHINKYPWKYRTTGPADLWNTVERRWNWIIWTIMSCRYHPSNMDRAIEPYHRTLVPLNIRKLSSSLYIHWNFIIQHNPAISNSLISKFRLYRSSICGPAWHNVNTKDSRLYRNLDISKYSSRSPELRYNRIIL